MDETLFTTYETVESNKSLQKAQKLSFFFRKQNL